jgi:hypothetical protein
MANVKISTMIATICEQLESAGAPDTDERWRGEIHARELRQQTNAISDVDAAVLVAYWQVAAVVSWTVGRSSARVEERQRFLTELVARAGQMGVYPDADPRQVVAVAEALHTAAWADVARQGADVRSHLLRRRVPQALEYLLSAQNNLQNLHGEAAGVAAWCEARVRDDSAPSPTRDTPAPGPLRDGAA